MPSMISGCRPSRPENRSGENAQKAMLAEIEEAIYNGYTGRRHAVMSARMRSLRPLR